MSEKRFYFLLFFFEFLFMLKHRKDTMLTLYCILKNVSFKSKKQFFIFYAIKIHIQFLKLRFCYQFFMPEWNCFSYYIIINFTRILLHHYRKCNARFCDLGKLIFLHLFFLLVRKHDKSLLNLIIIKYIYSFILCQNFIKN